MWHRDLFPFFRAPVETLVPMNLSQPVRLCQLNPDRVVLILGSANNINIFISTIPNATSSQGFIVPSTAQPFVLTQAQHGNLCQCEWWATAASTGNSMCVIEIILDRKPTLGPIHV